MLEISVDNAIESQAVINVGMIGHVADGKSTIVKALTGTSTQRHSKEQITGKTIDIGYANAKIYKCPNCPKPLCFQSASSSTMIYKCIECDEICDLINHISFVDCPGHATLMTTMMNGANVMDYFCLVESAENELRNIGIPAPQTKEHLEHVKHAGISMAIAIMNKFDLVSKSKAAQIIKSLSDYLKTIFHSDQNNQDNQHNQNNDPIIIPISASLKININILCEMLGQLKVPQRDLKEQFKMLVIKSYSINLPRTPIAKLKGGCMGGTLIKGSVKVGTDVLLFPGYINKSQELESPDKWYYTPIKCKILSLRSDETELQYALSGGLISMQLDIDSALTSENKMKGQVIIPFCSKNNALCVFEQITVKYTSFRAIKNKGGSKQDEGINSCESYEVNINCNNIKCTIIDLLDDKLILSLEHPVAVEINDKITLSEKGTGDSVTIYGYGFIQDGIASTLVN